MITIEDVNKAQQAWGEGIVAISAAHSSGGDYVALATQHVETLYAYDIGKLLFKPTLAAQEQFRLCLENWSDAKDWHHHWVKFGLALTKSLEVGDFSSPDKILRDMIGILGSEHKQIESAKEKRDLVIKLYKHK